MSNNIHIWSTKNFNESSSFFENKNKIFKLLWVEDQAHIGQTQKLSTAFNESVDIYLATSFESALYLIDSYYSFFDGFILDIQFKKHKFDTKNNPYLDADKLVTDYAKSFIEKVDDNALRNDYDTNTMKSGGVWLWLHLMSKKQRKPILFYSGNMEVLGDITHALTAFGLIGFWSKGHEFSQKQLEHFMNTCRENLLGVVPWRDIKQALYEFPHCTCTQFKVNGQNHSLQEFFPENNLNESYNLEKRLKWVPPYNQSTLLNKFFESTPVRDITHSTHTTDLSMLKLLAQNELNNLQGQLNPKTFDKIQAVFAELSTLKENLSSLKASFESTSQSKIEVGSWQIKLAKRHRYLDLDVLKSIIDLSLQQCGIQQVEQLVVGKNFFIDDDSTKIQILGCLNNSGSCFNLLEKILNRQEQESGSFFKLHQESEGYTRISVGQLQGTELKWLCLNSYRYLEANDMLPSNGITLSDEANQFVIDIDFSVMSDIF